MVNRSVNFLTLFLFFQTISLKRKKEKKTKYKNERNLFYSRFGLRIDLDGQPHPRTVLTEQGISKERTETLFSVQPEETCRKEVVWTKGIEENGSFCAPSLQGIARWKNNNNIFNSTNEFCFSYLFKIPRRLKCSLEMRRRMPLPSYFLFHPSYFFSPFTFGHFWREGEGETEETMQFHLWDSGGSKW